jgi:type IV secretory pathway ATPase VirB11/archaellum biosynthesis ATPase
MSSSTTFTDGRLVEQTVDNGDGTGTRTTFHADGTVDTVEQLTGLPIPPPPEPDPMADMQQQLAAQQALIDELLAALGGGGNG